MFLLKSLKEEEIIILKEILKNTLIVCLILILLKVSYSKFIEKEYPVKLFGLAFLIVTTGSMEPEIKAGELIVIKESNEYKENEIVTFTDQDDFLVTHRIVELKDNSMITKGDNNNLLDGETLLKNIKGKVIFHSKILGFFVLYLLKPLLFIYIIFIFILNIIKFFFTTEREEKINESDETEEKVEINISN